MEDRGGEDGLGAALGDALDQVAQLADPARGDHRDRDRVGHRAGQRQVVAVGGAVAIHAREQHLPRPALGRLARPGDGVAPLDRGAPAVDVDVVALGAAPGVDRDHHALGAEDVGELGDQLRAGERRRVDRDLVGAGVEHRLGVGDRADPAPDHERDEDVVGGPAGELGDRVAPLVRRRDVEEDELVGALAVVALGELDRVARVAQADEVRPLDDPPRVHVEARDHALEGHRADLRARAARARGPRPRRRARRPRAPACRPGGAAPRARSPSGWSAACRATSRPGSPAEPARRIRAGWRDGAPTAPPGRSRARGARTRH